MPVDADLLDRGNWTFSNAIPRNASWLDGKFTGWLEGNAVATADGRVRSVAQPKARAEAAVAECKAKQGNLTPAPAAKPAGAARP